PARDDRERDERGHRAEEREAHARLLRDRAAAATRLLLDLLLFRRLIRALGNEGFAAAHRRDFTRVVALGLIGGRLGRRACIAAVADLLDALLLGLERDAAAIDDQVVALQREVHRLADVDAVRGADLQRVLTGLVTARARQAEVEVGALEDLALR